MPDVRAAIIPVTPFQQNCTLLWCEKTKKAAVVDPGGDLDRIREAIAQSGVERRKDHPHPRPYRSCGRRGGAAGRARRAGRRPARGGPLPARAACRAGTGLRLSGPRRHARSLAQRGRHGQRRRPHPRRAALPRPFAGQRRAGLATISASRLSATCCSRAPSGAPTFPAATARR